MLSVIEKVSVDKEHQRLRGVLKASIRLCVAALFAALLFACAHPPYSIERALIEPKMVSEAIALEQLLNSREDVPIPAGSAWFEVKAGDTPLIITATHATRVMRNGKYRHSDGGGTAALAELVHQLTGATILYTMYDGPSDPNYYDDNAFKETLATLIDEIQPQVVLDIHGSHPHRSYDVDFGTMNGASLLDETRLIDGLSHRLKAEGISSLSNNRFAASKNQTITKFAAAKGIPAIQLEINATYLMPSEGPVEAQRFSIMAQALVRFINQDILSD